MYIGIVTQAISIALIWAGICTPMWTCGDLFEECNKDKYQNVHYILFAGACCVTVAFALEFVIILLRALQFLQFIKMVIQFVGGVLMLSGLIIYYSVQSNQVSELLTTMGSTAFIFASVFGVAEIFIPIQSSERWTFPLSLIFFIRK